MDDYKYNYVFFNIYKDYLEPEFFPLKKIKNVKIYHHAFDSGKFIDQIFFYHWSAKLNRICTLPFKKIWFKKMLKQDFGNNKPICYVFFNGKYIMNEKRLYSAIKKRNPENKVISYYDDVISKRNINLTFAKNNTDFIVTYDEYEAKKYNIQYFDALCYEALDKVSTPTSFEYDVYFIGYAKDRIQEIHDTYLYLKNLGLRCKFIVCGISENRKLPNCDIEYNKEISYKENIENVKKSRCILEIVQKESTAPTLRLKEAQVYRRKLLTNNTFLKGKDYYNEKEVLIYSKVEDIHKEFLLNPIHYEGFEKNDKLYKCERFIELFERLCSDVK